MFYKLSKQCMNITVVVFVDNNNNNLQRDSLSPFLFILAMIPLKYMQWNNRRGYKSTNIQKNWTAQYICITLKKNCKKIILQSGCQNEAQNHKICNATGTQRKKKSKKKGTELCNQEIIKTLKRKKNYKYLQILKAESIIMTWKGQQKGNFWFNSRKSDQKNKYLNSIHA